jgi:uncharacterized protein
MNIPLRVDAVISDPNSDGQIVILKDQLNLDILPIWVGMAEGNAIRFAMEGIAPPRPLSHDLLRDLLDKLDVHMEKVVIHDIQDNTYYASLHLTPNRPKQSDDMPDLLLPERSEEKTVDARPSDAIALALRMSIPIYGTDLVLQKKGSENLDIWLEKLKPGDFGPYDT